MMTNGELNVNLISNCNMITTSMFMESADHMAISLRVSSHPLEDSIPTTVVVTLVMTGQRIPAYLQTQVPQTGQQHHTRHKKLNGITAL